MIPCMGYRMREEHRAIKYLHFHSKTRAKNYHPGGREVETPGLKNLRTIRSTAVVLQSCKLITRGS